MSDAEPPPVLRETTVYNFLKDRTGLRVRDEATEIFITHFTTIAEAVAIRAGELAEEDERTTLLERDVDIAFNEFLQAGPQILGPGPIHTAIAAVSNQDLTQLIQLLRADLTPPATPP